MKYWKDVVCALVMMVWSWGCGNQEVVTILVGDALAADVPAQIQVSQGLPQGELCVCQNGSEWPLEVTGEYILFLPTEAIAKASELEIRPCDKLIASVNIRRSNGALRVSKQEKEVFSFVEEIKLPDANTPNYYGRNGFIDPMRSPAGVKLTEAYPRGHTHQHGIFHAWTRSTISGKMIDFWNQAAQLGNVRLVDVEQIEEGPVVASFVANLEYLAYLEQDTIVAAHEQWIVQTYAGPEQAHVVDVEII
ncbi:MAG: PmoA family protein, partial [Saprospiraceae bacterium]|nr:PmoA family protein [Saprospiraceae bacterium]